YTAFAQWMLGYPDRARRRSREALDLARQIDYAPTLASGLYCVGVIDNWLGDWSSALSWAQETLGFASQQGLPFWIGRRTCLLGSVMARQGQYREGLARQREGLASYQATGARVGLSQRLFAMAEAHGQAGQYAEALAVLAELEAWCSRSGELLYLAEATRLRGELVLRQALAAAPRERPVRKAESGTGRHTRPRLPSAAEEAEACFHKALVMARRQEARAWELRAAMCLAELWRQEGKTEDARRLLGDIYSWFTEGFESADLRAAK